MIVVVADDFTGAAELAGISLSFGLTVDLALNTVTKSNADVIVVCTDSRSLKKQNALAITQKVFEDIKLVKPSLIYKKIDSVLRGYVLDELKVQMQVLQLNKALIVPANPSLSRQIIKGKYFVDGIEIAKTAFANDPEFPVKSSLVKDILNDNAIEVLSVKDQLPEAGIIVAESSNENDLKSWTQKVDTSFALIGAGDFYSALLEKRFSRKEIIKTEISKPYLFVAGSAFAVAKKRLQEIKSKAKSIQSINKWFELIQVNNQTWVLSVKENIANISALELRTEMAKSAQQLLNDLAIKEFFIEGGSTAAAILSQLNIHQLKPVIELSRGIVRMQFNQLLVTVKPGSYPLPSVIEQIINPPIN